MSLDVNEKQFIFQSKLSVRSFAEPAGFPIGGAIL